VSELPAPEYTESGYRVPAAELQPAPRRSFGQRVVGALVATGAFLAKFGALLYKLKIFTVVGGAYASVDPEYFDGFCDVLFKGEAETTWPAFIDDYAAGRPTKRFMGAE
jgi:hypothetical protein